MSDCDRCGKVIPQTQAPVWADSICDECTRVPLCASCAEFHLSERNQNFPDGWLHRQVEKSARSLDGLDPQVRAALAHRTGKDNAAGLRGLKSKLEQLNDDGTPAHPVGVGQEIIGGWVDEVQHFAAEPTQEDGPTYLSAEQGTTPEAKPSAVEVAELGDAIGRNVSAAGSPWISEKGTGRSAMPASAYLDALLGIDRSDPEQMAAIYLVNQNVHAVSISEHALNCIPTCSGSLPHVHEYRAADVRPSTEQTARNSAAGS